MPGPISLHDLIESMANAVIEAQDRIERYQISNLSRYFDQDDRPVSVPLRLPNNSPQAGSDEPDRVINVPLLALVTCNQLKIKDVEIAFDVDLGDFADTPPAPSAAPADQDLNTTADSAWNGAKPEKTLAVDMRSGTARDQGASARIVLRLEGQEPPEGMARLIQHLLATL